MRQRHTDNEHRSLPVLDVLARVPLLVDLRRLPRRATELALGEVAVGSGCQRDEGEGESRDDAQLLRRCPDGARREGAIVIDEALEAELIVMASYPVGGKATISLTVCRAELWVSALNNWRASHRMTRRIQPVQTPKPSAVNAAAKGGAGRTVRSGSISPKVFLTNSTPATMSYKIRMSAK